MSTKRGRGKGEVLYQQLSIHWGRLNRVGIIDKDFNLRYVDPEWRVMTALNARRIGQGSEE